MICAIAPLRGLKDLIHRGLGIERVRRQLQQNMDMLETRIAQEQAQHGTRLRIEMLRQRRFVTTSQPDPAELGAAKMIEPLSLEEAFLRLQEQAPQAFSVWHKLLDVNAAAYNGFPVDSCSVENHEMAEAFRSFVKPYLRGRVLDIGCGPQPLPAYLGDHSLELIYGIDPLSRPDDHPFSFQSGVAEYLPWESSEFHTAIAATSLDHVLLLDRTYEEIRRVLRKPDGCFLVWIADFPGAAPYNPFREDIEPIDEYHLFHFDCAGFEHSIRCYFTVCEKFSFDPPQNSVFYCLRAK